MYEKYIGLKPSQDPNHQPKGITHLMIINFENLMDSLRRMRDLHTLHEATGSCIECHNPWPCDTDSYLTKATKAFDAEQELADEPNSAVELGKVLAAVESRIGLEGPWAEKVISKLHHLVLEHGIDVTGQFGFETEYLVGITINEDSYQPLWRLSLGQQLSIEIFATTGRATSKRFLSQVLMDTFAARDASQMVTWWETNDDACQRMLTLYYDDPVSITKTILMLVEATIRFNNSVRTQLHRD